MNSGNNLKKLKNLKNYVDKKIAKLLLYKNLVLLVF